MERRLGTRKQTSISVYLARPGAALFRCRASDISTSGVFVELGCNSLAKGSTVELIFVLKRGSLIRIHRLPAIVARVVRAGAGMMLYKSSLSHLHQHPSASL